MERTRQEMERTKEEMVQALKGMGITNILSPKLSEMASRGQKVASPSVVKDLDQLLVDDDDCVPIKPFPLENKGLRKCELAVDTVENKRVILIVCSSCRIIPIAIGYWAVVAFNIQAGRGNKALIVKYISGCPKQPGGIECGYVVMRYMKEIVMDSEMSFLKKWSSKSCKLSCSRVELDEVRCETAAHIEKFL
ncbi:hypothetical protein POM88_007285 [Heracleum sosnowskyi]|uniref:Uncharacterized protein n=1 Tax=Heracleum sosnowskyi TaxID=360622 RepID=A0AAD8J7L1_9APIA|nr:hypothetical protein POM88_007285 [Heracleum sosnowskyi]